MSKRVYLTNTGVKVEEYLVLREYKRLNLKVIRRITHKVK